MVAVLDAGIVMNTSILPEIKEDMVIAESAFSEIKSQQAKHVMELLIAKKQLSIVSPLPSYIRKIEKTAADMGQNNLSSQDIDVLAVAVMMIDQSGEVLLYSDDYGVRNVAHQLDIPSKGVTTTGGNQKRRYKYKCQGCGAVYKQSITECDICGHDRFKRWRR